MSVDYELLGKQLEALLSAESDPLSNSANFVALLYSAIPNINWLGIYVIRGNELVLGPFQGQPACTRIPLNSGVCGKAASTKQSMRIDDVLEFDGHIACDPASRSELVVPLTAADDLFAVVDIDSPHIARFSDADQIGVERLCDVFVSALSRQGKSPMNFI